MGTTDRTAAERQRRRRIKLKAVEQRENVTLPRPRGRTGGGGGAASDGADQNRSPRSPRKRSRINPGGRGRSNSLRPTPVRGHAPGAGKITGGGTTAVRVSYTISDAEPNVSLPKDSRVYGPPAPTP